MKLFLTLFNTELTGRLILKKIITMWNVAYIRQDQLVKGNRIRAEVFFLVKLFGFT